jgi:D-ribose pyranose/furanose isomerase RbsD
LAQAPASVTYVLKFPSPYHHLTFHQHIAAAFTTKGIDHIILLARNLQRLQNEDAPFVSKASSNVKVDSVRIDLSDTKSIPSVLKELDTLTKGEDIEVIVFNAARIKPSETLTTDVEELHEDLNVRLTNPHDMPPRLTHPRSPSSPSTSYPSTTSPNSKHSPNPTCLPSPRFSFPTATCLGIPYRSCSPCR